MASWFAGEEDLVKKYNMETLNEEQIFGVII